MDQKVDEDEQQDDEEENAHPAESKAAKLSDLIEYVTVDNLKDFSLNDVVMPMLGHDVKLPKNDDLLTIFSEILA